MKCIERRFCRRLQGPFFVTHCLQGRKGVKKAEASKHPQIISTTRWHNGFYLFFSTMGALDEFLRADAVGFKKASYDIIKKYDIDGFCSMESSLYFTLDLLENLESAGSQGYFKSNAMEGLFVIS